jgi:hypothetical protein
MADTTASVEINKQANRFGVHVNTTDATQTTAATFTTRSNKAYKAIAKIIATETADFDEIGDYWLEAAFKNDGGTLSLVGSVRSIHTANESTAGWDATIDASGSDIRVRVTGAADTAITWLVQLEVIEVGAYLANYGVTP